MLRSTKEETPSTADTACRICASSGPHSLHVAQEMMFGMGDHFRYFQCTQCGCLQILTIPEDIGKYYASGYYAHIASPESRFKNPLRAALLQAKARYAVYGKGLLGRALFARVPDHDLKSLRSVNPKRSAAILDVGCGNGRLLYSLRQIGFENVLGADPFIERDVTYGNGVRIVKRFLSEISGAWDVVMLHHAFEHLSDPQAALQDIRRLLKPSGVCILRIPKADSYAWQHYATNWVQLDAPRHFFLHTRTSVQQLAENAGLHLTDVIDDSTEFQFMGSELYRRGIPHQEYSRRYAEFFTKSEIADFRARADQLNRSGDGDSAAFYLRIAP